MNYILDTIASNGTVNEFILKKINKQDKHGNTILHNAFLYQKIDSIIVLLKYDINPNIQNLDGNTVLHLALFNFNLMLSKTLAVLSLEPSLIKIISHFKAIFSKTATALETVVGIFFSSL